MTSLGGAIRVTLLLRDCRLAPSEKRLRFGGPFVDAKFKTESEFGLENWKLETLNLNCSNLSETTYGSANASGKLQTCPPCLSKPISDSSQLRILRESDEPSRTPSSFIKRPRRCVEKREDELLWLPQEVLHESAQMALLAESPGSHSGSAELVEGPREFRQPAPILSNDPDHTNDTHRIRSTTLFNPNQLG